MRIKKPPEQQVCQQREVLKCCILWCQAFVNKFGTDKQYQTIVEKDLPLGESSIIILGPHLDITLIQTIGIATLS